MKEVLKELVRLEETYGEEVVRNAVIAYFGLKEKKQVSALKEVKMLRNDDIISDFKQSGLSVNAFYQKHKEALEKVGVKKSNLYLIINQSNQK